MAPICWEERWSDEAKLRQQSGLLSAISTFAAVKGGVGMHGGLPPPSTFPFQETSMTLAKDHGVISLEGQPMIDAQQYIFRPGGYAPLSAFLEALSKRMHKPKGPVEVVMTNGASQAIDCLVTLLLNRGDALLVERFCYSHALEAQFKPRGLDLVPVPMDTQGLDPAALDALMHARQEAGQKLPRVLYCIPRGQNPTGACMSPARLAALYAVARKWDLVVLEDDAYYWLQHPDSEGGAPKGLDLPPGLLSLDDDGRVIRIDTFSKLLGPGFRVGWVTAPPLVAGKLALSVFSSTMGASSLSQVSLQTLLAAWGDEGLDAFVKNVQLHYARQASAHHAAATKYLSPVASWTKPKAGMFLWMQLKGLACSDALVEAGMRHKVMIVPGRAFWAEGLAGHHPATTHAAPPPPCPYFRVSFANVAGENVEEGYKRLREAIDDCTQAEGRAVVVKCVAAAVEVCVTRARAEEQRPAEAAAAQATVTGSSVSQKGSTPFAAAAASELPVPASPARPAPPPQAQHQQRRSLTLSSCSSSGGLGGAGNTCRLGQRSASLETRDALQELLSIMSPKAAPAATGKPAAAASRFSLDLGSWQRCASAGKPTSAASAEKLGQKGMPLGYSQPLLGYPMLGSSCVLTALQGQMAAFAATVAREEAAQLASMGQMPLIVGSMTPPLHEQSCTKTHVA